jgi:hypothetical protein
MHHRETVGHIDRGSKYSGAAKLYSAHSFAHGVA